MVTTRKKFGGGKHSISAHGIHELVLWAENDQSLYRQIEAWSTNFAKKMRSGKFNRGLAIKGIANHLVANTQKDYKKKFGSGITEFGIPTRMTAIDKRKVAIKLLPSIIEGAKYKLKSMKPLKRKKR